MAHLASSPPAAKISMNGTIYPHWYNVDQYAFQPAQSAGLPQDCPTIVETSPRRLSDSPFQLSSPVPATRQRQCDKDRSLDSKSNPPATNDSRQPGTKVCARCKKGKIKCILGDGDSCLRCDCMGVRCDLPAARQPREKELTRRSGKAPRERCVFVSMNRTDILTCDQDSDRPSIESFKLAKRAGSDQANIGGDTPRERQAYGRASRKLRTILTCPGRE